MRDEKRKRVFVSYSPADRAIAKKLIGELASHGMVVCAGEQVPHGTNFSNWIDEAVKSSDAFIVVVGPEHEPREGQLREWSGVLEEKWREPSKHLIPVLIDNAKIPNFLSSFKALRIESGTERLTFSDLIKALKHPADWGKSASNDEESSRERRERLDYIGRVATSLKE